MGAARLPAGLEKLDLNFSECNYIRSTRQDGGLSEKGVEQLVKNLPADLSHLNLNLYACFLPSESILAVASHLPARLTHLSLDFSCNLNISRECACALAERLPLGLTKLSLNLSDCKVGHDGASALAQNLPAGLVEL